MAKNLITPGQSLRRIISKEIASSYIFLGDDSFFHDIIVEGISNIFLSEEGEKVTIIMGIDREDDLLNHLNMSSLFAQKSIIIVKNPKKISSKYHSELIDFFKTPIEDKVIVFIYDDPYISNKFFNSIASYATCIDMRTPFPNKMKEWVSYYLKKNNINFPNKYLDDLIENYGDRTDNVINEINKIDIFTNGEVEGSDYKFDANIHKKENQLWKLVDSIGKKDALNSIDIYSSLYNSNIPVIRMLLNLLDLFKEIINQKIGISPGKFVRNKIILKNLNIYGKRFSVDELLHAIKILRDCDFLCKTTSINEKFIFHSVIVEICKGKNV